MISDVNVHKTNLFLDPNFQLVLITKRNETFYASFTVIKSKIQTVSIKNSKKKIELN
jgi:hypothetical protein